MPDALIGLGSNLGQRKQTLDRAVELLAATNGIANLRTSTWHESAPVGGPSGQSAFLNGAVRLETSLSAEALLDRLQAIENELGRVRDERWGPRSIDLDLLLYAGAIIHTPRLVVPHPRMAFRRFALEAAAEIAGDMPHPEIGLTVAELFRHLQTAEPYVAITGPAPADSRRLAQSAAASAGWQMLEFQGAGDIFAPSGSPSLNPERSIEFLHRWTESLAVGLAKKTTSGVLTSVWIEDLLAMGDVLWPGVLDAPWQELSARVPHPKLLVYYRPASTSPMADPTLERIDDARRRRARRQGRGPVLWLDNVSETDALTEIIAAIAAMH